MKDDILYALDSSAQSLNKHVTTLDDLAVCLQYLSLYNSITTTQNVKDNIYASIKTIITSICLIYYLMNKKQLNGSPPTFLDVIKTFSNAKNNQQDKNTFPIILSSLKTLMGSYDIINGIDGVYDVFVGGVDYDAIYAKIYYDNSNEQDTGNDIISGTQTYKSYSYPPIFHKNSISNQDGSVDGNSYDFYLNRTAVILQKLLTSDLNIDNRKYVQLYLGGYTGFIDCVFRIITDSHYQA